MYLYSKVILFLSFSFMVILCSRIVCVRRDRLRFFREFRVRIMDFGSASFGFWFWVVEIFINIYFLKFLVV